MVRRISRPWNKYLVTAHIAIVPVSATLYGWLAGNIATISFEEVGYIALFCVIFGFALTWAKNDGKKEKIEKAYRYMAIKYGFTEANKWLEERYIKAYEEQKKAKPFKDYVLSIWYLIRFIANPEKLLNKIVEEDRYIYWKEMNKRPHD